MAQRGGQTDIRTDVRTYVRTENLPILQDFVPYRGRCPKSGELVFVTAKTSYSAYGKEKLAGNDGNAGLLLFCDLDLFFGCFSFFRVLPCFAAF